MGNRGRSARPPGDRRADRVRRRSRDTGGELLEMNLMLGPSGFVAAAHVHPNQEERFEISGAPAMFRVAGVERLYQPGEVAVVPAGAPRLVETPARTRSRPSSSSGPPSTPRPSSKPSSGWRATARSVGTGCRDPLQMMVFARDYRRELQLPRGQQRVLYPIATPRAIRSGPRLPRPLRQVLRSAWALTMKKPAIDSPQHRGKERRRDH